MTDLYTDLGVGKTASKGEIKAAFRKGAKKHHPDIGGDPERFSRLAIAYSTLGNDEARAHYDATGETQGRRADPAGEQARALISLILLSLLERIDLLTIDLPKVLAAELAKSRQEVKQGVQAAQALRDKVTRLKAAQKKLRTKAEGDADIIGSLITSKIDNMETSIRNIDAEVKRATEATDLAIEMVRTAAYEYQPDKVDPNSMPFDRNSAMGIAEIMKLMEAEARANHDKERKHKRPTMPWESPFGP